MSRTITIECRYPVSADQVYAAFADARNLTAWFAEHARVDLPLGVFEFWGKHTPGAPDTAASSLLDHEPGWRLRFNWSVREYETPVAIEFTPDDGGTLLTLTQEALKRPFGKMSIADYWSLVLENLRRYLLGTGEIYWIDHSTPRQGPVDAEIEIQADPETVYRALVDPKELERYIAAKATVESEVGGRYDFGWGAGPIKILEIDPPRKLRYTWNYGAEGDTVVTWSLKGSDGRTRVTLVHSGFAPDRPSEDYGIGWLKYLNQMKSMVEIGEPWVASKVRNPDHDEGEYE